jgi:hypothetical protein
MKILNALILLSAALPAFGQIVVDPDYDRSSHGNADPSLGRFGKCRPGDIYIGPAETCFIICDNNNIENRLYRYYRYPMKKGAKCYYGATMEPQKENATVGGTVSSKKTKRFQARAPHQALPRPQLIAQYLAEQLFRSAHHIQKSL